MEDINRLVILYDYYGELLTDHQKKCFEDYYFNNLSLSEIALNNNVTRNAVHNQLKKSIEKLEYYESKLKIIKKNNKVLEILKFSDLKEEIMNILEGE